MIIPKQIPAELKDQVANSIYNNIVKMGQDRFLEVIKDIPIESQIKGFDDVLQIFEDKEDWDKCIYFRDLIQKLKLQAS